MGIAMSNLTWKIVFFDNRASREGEQTCDCEKDFYSRIEAIKADHWLRFIKGILPNGQEIRA
jgi:hypothetical protein